MGAPFVVKWAGLCSVFERGRPVVTTTFASPLGDILLAANSKGLVGLWFVGQEHFGSTLMAGADVDGGAAAVVAGGGAGAGAAALASAAQTAVENVVGADAESGAAGHGTVQPVNAAAKSIIDRTWAWLNAYFAGQEPRFTPPLHMVGTPFQREVWAELLSIPRGTTVSYGEIARRIAAKHWRADDPGHQVSARAVGSAVARNPVSIIVPCHRVVAANGDLTGYAAGLDRKQALLTLEGALA